MYDWCTCILIRVKYKFCLFLNMARHISSTEGHTSSLPHFIWDSWTGCWTVEDAWFEKKIGIDSNEKLVHKNSEGELCICLICRSIKLSFLKEDRYFSRVVHTCSPPQMNSDWAEDMAYESWTDPWAVDSTWIDKIIATDDYY